MRASNNGKLNTLNKCVITIPGAGPNKTIGKIELYNLPDLSDSKSAIYNSENIIGRSFPLYTYSHSGDRNINLQLHFFITQKGDGEKNLGYMRMLQSALYPRQGESGAPYLPPPVCTLQVGHLLAKQPICAVLQSCNVKFPTEVAWDEETYCPYRLDIDTTWLTVYTSSNLPYQDRIVSIGW